MLIIKPACQHSAFRGSSLSHLQILYEHVRDQNEPRLSVFSFKNWGHGKAQLSGL